MSAPHDARRKKSLVRRVSVVQPYDEGDPCVGELDVSAPQGQVSFGENMRKACSSAFRGGAAGAAAMAANVTCLLWMRTTIYYQYRNGKSFPHALKALFSQGGVPRFYRGIVPALIQGPLSRFGDTAANTGVLTLLNSMESTRDWSSFLKTAVASSAAACFRIVIMPIDTIKTSMQVNGSIQPLIHKIKTSGPSVVFHGSLAAASATFVGHFPWYFTFNYLSDVLPKQESKLADLARLATIGFVSSAVSDTCSNSIRVVKVNKQTSEVAISYAQAAKNVIQASGWRGLFFRGLETKLLANGLQGILFSVLWKNFEEVLFGSEVNV